MQEDLIFIQGNFRGREEEDLFAVFDGHGGRDSAEYAAKQIVAKLKEKLDNDEDPVESFKDIFNTVNNEIAGWAVYSGTTACVCLFRKNTLYVANVGDSRGVLISDGKVKRLTVDHNLHDTDERKRVEALGAEISDG